MSNLESIVPPVELCKLIPAGEFEDSAMVWVEDQDRIEVVFPREVAQFKLLDVYRMVPAPTMDEILEGIGAVETWDTMTMKRITNGKQSLTTNTLKRWFEVKGIEVAW